MKRISTLACILVLMTHLSWGQQGKKVKAQTITLGITEQLISSQLSEKRTLNIYLPEGYSQRDTVKYPVIYLLDGGIDEDFIHVTGLVQFNTFPWVSRMPKSIIVGIVNTDRKRDMTFPTSVPGDKEKYPTTGGSGKFIAFLEKELQPYIEEHYNTSGSKTIIGQSLGGLLVTEILLTKPQLFHKYIIISPSLWWDKGSLLNRSMTISSSQPAVSTNVYIGVGKEGLTPGSEPRVMEVDANLLAEKIRSAQNPYINLYFDYLPDEDHATIGHQAVSNAFRKLYQAK